MEDYNSVELWYSDTSCILGCSLRDSDMNFSLQVLAISNVSLPWSNFWLYSFAIIQFVTHSVLAERLFL